MSAAIYNQHVTNTTKVSNVTHTGDVTDLSGVLTVKKINGVSLENLSTGILKNTTGTGSPSIAVAADFPTLNQDTEGNAAAATLATTATNIAGGSAGSIPYQSGSGSTSLLNAGTAGYVLTSDGSAAPYWSPPLTLVTGVGGAISVSNGGSGATTFSSGILTASGTSAFSTITKPSGDLVGTNATQTITNKTFGSGNTFSSPISIADGGTGNSTGNLSNCTGLPLGTGVTGTLPVTNGGTGTTMSTGAGAVVLANSPQLNLPYLGTPLGGTLTNCTGLPLNAGTIGNLPASRIDDLPDTVTVPAAGYVISNGVNLSSVEKIPANDIDGLPTGGGDATVPPAGYVTSDGTELQSVLKIPASDIDGLTGGGNAVVPTTAGVVTSNGNQLLSSTALPVSLGGTGVSSPNGYFFGNNNGTVSFSATIPYSAIDGAPAGGIPSGWSEYTVSMCVANTTVIKTILVKD